MATSMVRCPRCGTKCHDPGMQAGETFACSGCGHRICAVLAEPGSFCPSPATEVSGLGTVQCAVTALDRQLGADGIPLSWEPADIILDLYEVRRLSEESPYAEGGMGRVNRVWHRGWQMDLAVKSVNPQYLQRPGAVEHFQREAEVWVNKLNLHPNLVFCYYVRVLGGLPRIFVEYVDGGDLAHWVESGKLYEGGPQAALARILDVAIQSAWGLHAIHSQGLVHQDVKPRNVLMTHEGIAKVTDFGIARARAAAEAVDTTELQPDVTALAGTRSYQSPEQAAGRRLTLATDVWSWAVSVLDLFVGKVERGFGPAAALALEQHVAEGGKDQRRPPMPSAVVELLRRCFRNRSDDRPHSMLEIANRLRDCYETTTGQPYPHEWTEPAEALADSLNNRALSLYDSLDRREEAEQKWQEALVVDPLHPEATYNLGLIQWRAGRITDEQLLNQLLQLRTSCADPARVDYLIGLVHLERNDVPAAVAVLSRTEDAGRGEAAAALATARRQVAQGLDLPAVMAGHEQEVRAVAFSPNGKLALSGGADRRLRLWDVASGNCMRTFDRDAGCVTAAAFSPDGQYALSGSQDHVVCLWDISSGRCSQSYTWGRQALARIVLSLAILLFLLTYLLPVTLRFWIVPSEWVLLPMACFMVGWLVLLLTFAHFRSNPRKVLCLAWGPDDDLVLCGSSDETIQLRHEASGSLVEHMVLQRDDVNSGDLSWPQLTPILTPVTALTFSPDRRFVLSGRGRNLALWEISSPRWLGSFAGHTDTVTAISWSADGLFALSGAADTALRLWEVASGRCLRTFEGHRGEVTGVALSPDGRFALSGSADRTVRVWDIASGRCLRTLVGHAGPVTAVALSPDGRLALSASSDQTLRSWPIAPPGPPMPLAASRPSTSMTPGYPRLLQDARQALAAGEPGKAAALLAQARRMPGCGRRADALDLARHLARLLPRRGLVEGLLRHALLGHGDRISAVVFSPDGGLLLSGDRNGMLRLWDVNTGRCLENVAEGAPVTSVVFSPNGRFVLSGDQRGGVQVRTIPSGSLWRSFKTRESALNSRLSRNLTNLESNSAKSAFDSDQPQIIWVGWGAEGCSALSGSQKGCLQVWDVASSACRRTFCTANVIHQLKDSRFAIGCIGGFCLLLGALFLLGFYHLVFHSRPQDSDNPARVPFMVLGVVFGITMTSVALLIFRQRSQRHSSELTALAWSAVGRYALTGGADRTVRLWQIAGGRHRLTLRGHTGAVTALAFSPDGRYALSGSADCTLRLCQLSTGCCLRSFEGHTAAVTSVAFSADGCLAVSGSVDHTVRLWEVASGRCLWVFEGHVAAVTSVALSPDGCLVLSGSADQSVRVWQLDWELEHPRPPQDSQEARTAG